MHICIYICIHIIIYTYNQSKSIFSSFKCKFLNLQHIISSTMGQTYGIFSEYRKHDIRQSMHVVVVPTGSLYYDFLCHKIVLSILKHC